MSEQSLRRLRYFVVLAEEQHYGRAAGRLFISQPALSAEIKRLESELGLELFHRSARGTTLTGVGERLARRANAVLDASQRFTEEARELADGRLGRVTVGAVQGVIQRVLPDVLRRLKQTAPGIRVEIVEMNTGAQLLAVDRGQLDIACTHSPAQTPGRASTLLQRERFLACFPADAAPRSRRIRLGELADEDFIVFRDDLSPHYYARLVEACADAGFTPRITHRTTTWQTVLQLVGEGLGIAVVPASVAETVAPARAIVSGPANPAETSPATDAAEKAMGASATETGAPVSATETGAPASGSAELAPSPLVLDRRIATVPLASDPIESELWLVQDGTSSDPARAVVADAITTAFPRSAR